MPNASMLKETHYQKLSNSSRSSIDELMLPTRRSRLHTRHWRWYLVALTTILVTSGLIFWYLHSQSQSIPSWVDCGTSPETARANGCVYEPMQRSWIPQACYFAEPSNDYHPFEEHPWFYDTNLTQPLDRSDLDKMRNGDDFTAYTPHFFHHDHCLYVWRKLAIAVERRLPLVDSKTGDMAHSHHCARKIAKDLLDISMDRFEIEGVVHRSISPIMFQKCVKLEWG